MKIATISASWHRDLLDVAKSSCVTRLAEYGLDAERDIEHFSVPGSLEIPLMALKLAKTGGYDGIIAFGLIVDGGVYRHEFVASSVIDGLMRVQLDTEVPVFSCVLTPHHFHEHADHLAFFREHLAKKGTEIAESAFSFVTQLSGLAGQDLADCG
ncbi:MAG: 6,7-dimethyl-8-ribityllumazine synthase [Luteolibacter sp.]